MSLELIAMQKLASLSKLAMPKNTVNNLAKDLEQIVELVKQINAVETETIEPMAHPLDKVQVLREDIVTETNNREQLQNIAPNIEASLYLVPQVID